MSQTKFIDLICLGILVYAAILFIRHYLIGGKYD